jgi:myo-inositol 2-dehydrogenase / D-chiro-inositol 1-dehydrogenase
MGKIGLGIIGLGYIGKVHLRSSQKTAGVELEAVADVSKRALNDAKKTGVRKTYSNYEDLLEDPKVDGVVIALPTHLHVDCAVKAAEAGKHIMLEKPIAKNSSDAKTIISAARRNSVKLMIGYPMRFTRVFSDLKSRLGTGELGDVVTAYAVNVSTGPFMHRGGHIPTPVPDWWFRKELTGGGALIDLGSHMINLLRWYFGEITDIRAQLGYRFNLDLEDQAICLARFETGTVGILNLGYFSQSYQVAVELLGTVNKAIADNKILNPLVAAVQMLSTRTTDFWRPYIAELEHFSSCVAKDIEPSPSANDGLRDLEAIEAAYNCRIR